MFEYVFHVSDIRGGVGDEVLVTGVLDGWPGFRLIEKGEALVQPAAMSIIPRLRITLLIHLYRMGMNG